MNEAPLSVGSDASNAIAAHPNAVPNLAAIGRIMARYDRPKLAAFIAVAIDLLDTLDGDSELEANGDEADAAWPENHGRCYLRQPEGEKVLEDCEDDDADSGIDDQGEPTDEREPEDYLGGGGLGVPNPNHYHITA